jgi:hypothetical protein
VIRLHSVVLAASFAVIPVVSNGQEASSFEGLSKLLRPDQRIAVTDAGGHTTRGHVADVSPASITVRVTDSLGAERTRTFGPATVATIRRSDRLWNGLLIGAGAGFVATELWAYRLCGPRGSDSECSAIVTGVGWTAFVPGGAVVGALIDKAIGNQLIYSAAPRKRTSMYVSPTIAPQRIGVTAALRF